MNDAAKQMDMMASRASALAKQALPNGVECVVIIADLRGTKPNSIAPTPMALSATVPPHLSYQIVGATLGMPMFAEVRAKMAPRTKLAQMLGGTGQTD